MVQECVLLEMHFEIMIIWLGECGRFVHNVRDCISENKWLHLFWSLLKLFYCFYVKIMLGLGGLLQHFFFGQLAREDYLELRQEASELHEYSNAKLERVTRYLGVLANKTRKLGKRFGYAV